MFLLSIRLFGPPEVEVDGERVKINRRKALALLAYLAVTQASHSRDALATMFWPEAEQSRSRASLRSTLWALKKSGITAWLDVEQEALKLCSLPDSASQASGSKISLNVDVNRFRDLLTRVQQHGHPANDLCDDCYDGLTEAVALYENDFLAGFTVRGVPAFEEWQLFQDSDLRQSLVKALESLVRFHSTRAEYPIAIPYARRRVAHDPLHEPAHQALMQLYARAGQTSAALRQYEVCLDLLDSELGLGPSAETQALYQRIRSGPWDPGVTGDVAKGELAGEASKSSTPHNLPLNLTPFIDREHERAALAGLLEDQSTRLLTIVGPGGIGKTRLALAAAGEQASQAKFSDGVYFVSLTSLSEPGAIIPAVAEAVGYPFQTDQRPPRQQVFDYLSQKSMLLVLDNFEHLLLPDQPDGAALIAELLQRAPQLKILITSREPLNLYEEQRYPLQGLPVTGDRTGGSGADYAAAGLFLQTVRRRLPAFELAAEDESALADICRLVMGMPLALELAASWTEMLSLHEIAKAIRTSLDFLETSYRNVPARHRSMQAVFDPTWRSLSDEEQAVYAHLSVFRGGFTQEAAQAVTGADLKTLAGLVNKSLLRFDQAQSRYENHELLRQYAADKLGDKAGESRRRHAAYYCDFLHRRESDLKGSRQEQALAEIQADLENAVGAWQWAVEHSETTFREDALVPLCLFYRLAGRFVEGEAICRTGVEKLAFLLSKEDGKAKDQAASAGPSSQPRFLAKLLTWQGVFRRASGQFDLARQSLGQAQELLGALDPQDTDVIATRALMLLPLSDYSLSNEFGGKSEKLSEECVALFRSIDDLWGTAVALDALSQIKSNLGLHEQAIKLQEESLEIRQGLGDRRGIARSYNILGLLLLHVGQIEASEAYLKKSLSILRTQNNPALLSNPLSIMGINKLFAGKFEESLAAYEEAWAIHEKLGLPQEPLTANVGIARAKINLGRYSEARSQAENDLVRYREVDHSWSIAFTLFNLGRIDMVEGAMEQARERLLASAEIFQRMKEQSLLPDVLFCLAYTALAFRDRQDAIEYMSQALKIALDTEPLNPMRFELPGMALLLAEQGEAERAMEFYAAGLKSPYIANSRWFEDLLGNKIAALGAGLPQDVVDAAQERGQARDLWATLNAIMAELSEERVTPI